MSYNLVDPTTGDLTRVAGNSNIVDTAIEIDSTWSSKKINDSLEDIENIPRLTDFDEAIPEKGKNKIYYVNKTIGTYNCAQWRVESMYYDVSGLNQSRGVQKATSLNGVDNIMLMREYYLDDNNVMRWTAWKQLATMDKLVPFTRVKFGFKVVAYSDRTITGNSKLECLENWVTNALSKYDENLVIIGSIFNEPYIDGFAIVSVWGSKKDGILGASGIVVDQEGMFYYKKQNGVSGSGTLTKII